MQVINVLVLRTRLSQPREDGGDIILHTFGPVVGDEY